MLFPHVAIGYPQLIELGNRVIINHHTELFGQFGIKIGNQVMIGPYAIIISEKHRYSDWQKPICKQGFDGKAVKIEDDVWIGSFAVILPGVTVGRGAIVGSHTVVTKNVLPYSIVSGIPAKLIKYRFSRDKMKRALEIDWQNYL